MKKQLVESNTKLVYAVLHKHFPKWVKDEDMVAIGYLALCEAANRWDENRGKFSSFAYQCILNRFRVEFRNRKRKPVTVSLNNETRDFDNEPIEYQDILVGEPDIGYVDYETAYSKLSPGEREVLELTSLGLNSVEIAEQLGCAQSTVRMKLRTIKRTLRDYI